MSGFANRIARHFLFEKKHSPCLSLELSEEKKKEHSNLRLNLDAQGFAAISSDLLKVCSLRVNRFWNVQF